MRDHLSGSADTRPPSATRPRAAAATGRSRLILVGMAGNVMEWYDFAVYGYFASTLGRHFFPAQDPVASLLAAFGVFAVGFLMRPVGGLIFGHLGDRVGRRAALMSSALAMAVPTFLVGVLPDYTQLGVAASWLLVGLRLVQGLAIGGEAAASMVFLVEGAAPDERGFVGSWSIFGNAAGILLGSAVGALANSVFSPDAVDAWGWRVPFLLGLGVGLTGLYIRRHLPEVPASLGLQPPPASPVREALRTQRWAMLRVAGLNVLCAVGFYTLFVYAVTYMQQIVHVRAAEALDLNTFNMGILLLVLPAAGALSDRLGRKPLLLGSALGMLGLSWPLFWLIHHPVVSLMLVGQLGFAVLLGLFMGGLPATMAEAFPGRVRVTAQAFSYNLCWALLGGTAPLVVTTLTVWSHNPLAPAYYLMGAAAITLAVLLRWPETARAPLP